MYQIESAQKFKFSNLPKEIIDIILEFQGFHKNRNGIFIECICKNDKRYLFLQKNLNIISFDSYTQKLCVNFEKQHNNIYYLYIISTSIYGDHIHWYMDVFVKRPEFYIYSECKKKSIHYIFRDGNKQNKMKNGINN